jgi:formate dehydrogenase beta subunit
MQTNRPRFCDVGKPDSVRNTPKGRQTAPLVRAEIDVLLADAPRDKQYLIEYLHRIQDKHGYISADHVAALAEALRLSQVEVFEVATFYHHFTVVKAGQAPPPKNTIRVCNGLSCAMAGAGELFGELSNTCGADLSKNVRVLHAPCVGQCDDAPMAVVNQVQVRRASVGQVFTVLDGRSLTPTLSRGERGQLLDTCGADSPISDQKLPQFPLLEKCISGVLSIDEILGVLDAANLRGLGGAGFPAGRKWKIVRGFKGARALVVNADEGEPGTFKDRFYLERNPWQFWEGVLIAAWAVETQDVYVYLRDEYHDVRAEMTTQLAQIQQYLQRSILLQEPLSPREGDVGGLAGEGINGGDAATRDDTAFPHPSPLPEGEGARSALAPEGKTAISADGGAQLGKGDNNFAPNIELRRGAGAYICGEESALIESIEGKRGIPRLRPPYIAEVGVFGRPTLAHNVETLYWIPEILSKGAAWWNAHGRNGRVGLRSFSVSGRVNNPGVKLAPAGISVRELIDEFCGGMVKGHTLYGYLPGGASGGILPASLDHVPLDFDTLQPYGCFIGSAAVIVLSQHDRARDAALNMMQFFEHESCGQCTPCRAGTAKAAQLMAQPKWDEALLKELSQTMMDASICGLGQAAPNPLLCAMKYFPQEFL